MVWLAMASGREGSCVLVLESSWCDDVAVVVSSLVGPTIALDEKPMRAVTTGAGSEGNTS